MTPDRRQFLTFSGLGIAALTIGCSASETASAKTYPVHLSRAQWKKKLTKEQFYILREDGTERPFSSPLLNEHRAGIFACAGCDQHLFSSKTKFESGTGWPSFYQVLDGAVDTRKDGSLGVTRTEVHCARCGGHLGHLFHDGPKPTELRYCMDGAGMQFHPA